MTSLSQQSWLPAPHEDVAEWFIRDDRGRPILVYVSGLDRKHGFRDGMRVVLDARFYKRVEAEALDGRFHRYPAFVGELPLAAAGAGASWGRLWVVAIPVAILLGVFLILLVYARAGAPRPRPAARADWRPDDAEDLPRDPAEALAELRRRAEAGP